MPHHPHDQYICINVFVVFLLFPHQTTTYYCHTSSSILCHQPASLFKYCNIKGYSKCTLLIYPNEDIIFVRRDVIIVIGHHRFMK